MSVAEAIRIVQLHGSKTQRQSIQELEPPEEEIEVVRGRLFNKLERLRKREKTGCWRRAGRSTRNTTILSRRAA